GMLRPRSPDLLPVDHIAIAAPHGHGLYGRGVRAARRLGDAECLQTKLAARYGGKKGALLRLIAVTQQRSHDVHLRMARRSVAAGMVHLLEDRRGRRQRQTRAAVLFWNERGKISRLTERR